MPVGGPSLGACSPRRRHLAFADGAGSIICIAWPSCCGLGPVTGTVDGVNIGRAFVCLGAIYYLNATIEVLAVSPLPRVPGLVCNFQARTITVSWGLSFANGVDQWNWPTACYRQVAGVVRFGVQLMTGMWPGWMTLTIWPVQVQRRRPGWPRLLAAGSLPGGPFRPVVFSATHGVGRYVSQRHWCTILIRGKCQRR